MKNIFSRVFMSMLIVLLLTGFVNAEEVNYRNAYWKCYCGSSDTSGNQASTILLSDTGEVAVDGSNPSNGDDVTTTGWAYSNAQGSHYGYYKSSAAYDGSLGIQLKGHGTYIKSALLNTDVGTASVKTRMIDTDDGAPTTNYLSLLTLYASDYDIRLTTQEANNYNFHWGIRNELGSRSGVIPGGCSHDNLDWWTYTIELNSDNYATFTVNDGTNTCSAKVYHGIDDKFTGYGVAVDKQGSGSQWAIADFDNLLFIGQEEPTYDCAESYEGGPTSCKSSETWREYAEEFCEGHCYEDNSKCGVNSFKVWNECEKDIACKDSDGRDYYVRGTNSYQGSNTIEICSDENGSPTTGEEGTSVIESWCQNGVKKWEVYVCENGCKEGACVKEVEQVKCADSDGGKNYYKKGYVKYLSNGLTYDAEDECVIRVDCPTCWGGYDYKTLSKCNGDTSCGVHEKICSGDYNIGGVFYSCPNGCEDGACLKSTKEISLIDPSEVDLSNYPGLFIKDQKLNAFIVVGDQSQAEHVIAAVDIATSLQSKKGIQVGTTKLVSEVKDPLRTNLILIGGPCTNKISAQLMGNPSPCYKYLEKGEVMLKLFENNGYAQLLVTGYSNQGTRKAAKILSNWEDYNLRGKKAIFTTVIPEEEIISEETMPREHSVMDCGDGYCDPNAAEMWRNCPEDCEKPEERTLEKEKKPTVPECFSGCVTDHTCLPIGTRLINEGKASFCNINGKIEPQLGTNAQCMNYYECESNVCVNNRCMSGGLIQRIIDWFMGLFVKK